ncbi:PAS domain S-box protein [Geopsychrobacter electrodiphilus]|uniref:PAS domain S-box protein n=1 Tax=Geopsychrobacter electrodiphilus TaxID=225196 RepID=UPI000362F1D1|nr:PAS domain S-box protein [Geopsychrobacter electrodiphilus]
MKSAIKLLVVGTSPARLELVVGSLENQSGCSLHIVGSSADVRAYIAENQADRLVVLSLQSAPDAVSLLKSCNGSPEFVLLVLLDKEDTQAAVKLIKAGAVDVLVESPDLLKRLRQIIDNSLAEWTMHHREQLAIDKAASFGRILDSSLTEIHTVDTETLQLLRANRGARNNLGYSKQELAKMTLLDLNPLLSKEDFFALVHPLRMGKKETIVFEALHQRKDGSRYPVAVQLQLLRTETPIFVAVILDISERKRAEERLRVSEARFRSIFDTAAAGIVILSPYGQIQEVNPYFCNFSGYRAEELIGRNIEEVTYPDDREMTIDYYATLRQAQDPIINIEKRYLCKDGQIRWGYVSIACVSERDQSKNYCIGLVQDITNHKVTEAKMQQAYDELDAFVRTVAHDLRTPLTPIIGIAEILQSYVSGALDPDALNLLADIEKSGQHMLALLEDLLDLAQVRHVQQPAVPVDTRRMIDQVLQNLTNQIIAAKVKVKVGPLSSLCLPETLISQLFANLIGNAVRYAGDAGRPIEVGEERLDRQVIFYVRDHGPGIPPEERVRIFEVFYRGAAAKKIRGTGIGLATVRKITRLYHGDVWVEETPGGGSTFKLKFPESALCCPNEGALADKAMIARLS